VPRSIASGGIRRPSMSAHGKGKIRPKKPGQG